MSNGNTAPVNNVGGGFGTLQINTFLNSFGRPAEDAVVQITDPDTGIILEESKTNSNGQILPITLATPPLEFSMNPDLPRPFNQYNVKVMYPSYQEAIINNVQLFPDTAAVQNVTLTSSFEEIFIPYPVLWGNFPPKIPEPEVKSLPLPSNEVVLPEPVVPSLIVVHDGVPDDTSASNYTLGFKDYIKNVASSEIYSTWPIETLKANILVIISFTLNRVYTEWYRGKGYDFTITSSTAYDQAFSYGRNIYREISRLVDDLFTTYVTRPGIMQPLLTQYSDGRMVKRDGWLSQWGSKELGDRGLNAIQILRNYYGYNVFLKEAKKVEGIPLSFQGVLRIGSRGEAVRTIQHQLNAISRSFPAIPRVIEDGIYGASTAESVRIFQSIFGLPVNGIVNFPTWYRISDVFVAVEKLAELI
ncbi:MAG: peptidoglycan-binding protein [Eubacteriales bacterium]|nr:peptidoglycan-binding protein [Eubacteriales bacterium]